MVGTHARREKRRPKSDSPRESDCADAINAPKAKEIEWHHEKPHPVEISGMLAKKPENRSAEQLKERHVIIEHIPILDEPVCPGPNDMQMLRFIAVESEKEDIPELEESPQAEEACGDPNLRPAGQAEIVLKSANRLVYGRVRRHHIVLNHPSAKKARLNQVALISTLDIDEGCFLPSELERPASLKKEIRSRARAWRATIFRIHFF